MSALIPIVAILSVFGSPALIVWIVMHYRFRSKELAAGGAGDSKRVKQLETEKRALESRIENLESIVCSVDFELTQRLNRLAAQTSIAMPALPAAPSLPSNLASAPPSSAADVLTPVSPVAAIEPSITVRPPSAPGAALEQDPASTATTQLMARMGHLEIGQVVLGRYRIERELGRGGMGAVYLARDAKLGDRVALKVIASLLANDPQQTVARFHREVQSARRVTHPNVIRIHDIGEEQTLLFLSMEYVEGETLDARVRRRGALPIPEALELIRAIAAGVDAAHAASVIHRDLKPQNVLLGSAGEVKVIDFGLATTAYTPGMTATGLILGTPDYMAPEQVRGRPCDERTDIYALAAIAHFILAGRSLFAGETPIAVGFAHVHEEPTPLRSIRSEVPLSVEKAVLTALSKDPALRPRSAVAWTRTF